jgi:hypothetical protein
MVVRSSLQSSSEFCTQNTHMCRHSRDSYVYLCTFTHTRRGLPPAFRSRLQSYASFHCPSSVQ